jgi:hypothetical protein
MFFKIFLIFLLLQKELSFAIKCDSSVEKYRHKYRKFLKQEGVIFMIFGHAEWEKIYPRSSIRSKLKGNLSLPPALMQQGTGLDEKIELLIVKEQTLMRMPSLIMSAEVPIDGTFPIDDSCQTQSIQKVYVFSTEISDTDNTFLFRTCRIKRDFIGSWESKETYLMLTTNLEVLAKNVSFIAKMEHLKFHEFDHQPVCDCSNVNFYLNECVPESTVMFYVVSLFGSVILVAVVIFRFLKKRFLS